MNQFTVYLTKEDLDELKRQARELDYQAASYARRLIRKGLENQSLTFGAMGVRY